MDRRELIASALAAPALISLGAGQARAHCAPHKAAPPYRFSAGERARRWGLVRLAMADRGLDIVLCPHNPGMWDQLQAYGRWLVPMGGPAMAIDIVFPADPAQAVTAITPPSPSAGFWKGQQDWIDDIRPSMFRNTPDTIERLRELDADGKRIGVAGLGGTPRNPDGPIAAGMLAALEEAFPAAEFVDATDFLDDLREAKSEEEVAAMRQAVAIAEAGVEVLARESRPQVLDQTVFARVTGALLEMGSEPYSMFMWGAGPILDHSLASFPSGRPLQGGDVIFAEIEAKVAGYHGQVSRTAVVGQPDAELQEMFALTVETLARMQALIRPGCTFGELVRLCEEAAKGTPYACLPLVHGRGLGDDTPVLVYRASNPALLDRPIIEHSTLVTKVQVRGKGGKMTYWGDIVHVTADGATRLGAQKPELIICG